MEFKPWPKIPRLHRDVTITEKLDGTNACVIVEDDPIVGPVARGAQSRNRLITPDDDNQGFAQWVWEHRHILGPLLGPGHHYGEWVGPGIQGNHYYLNERRFYQFNPDAPIDGRIRCYAVPKLYVGPFDLGIIHAEVQRLRAYGTQISESGYAEGVIVYHHAARMSFKVTCYMDAAPKSGSY